MQVGVDIVKIERFTELLTSSFLNKYFTESEQEYIQSKANKTQTLAGLYACKEAVLKALGIGIGNGIRLNEINIIHKNGQPFIEVTSQIDYYLNKLNCSQISVSISHDGDYAVAFCTIC